MRRKPVIALVCLSLVAVSVGACSEEDVANLIEYNLTIENNTPSSYDVWIDNPLDTSGYYAAGHVAANRSTIIHELDIGIDYEVNLTSPDQGSASPAIHQRTVSSSDDDVIWDVFNTLAN